MIERNATNPKASKFTVNDTVRITKYNNIFNKDFTANWSNWIFVTDSFLKNHPLIHKTRNLNGEKLI